MYAIGAEFKEEEAEGEDVESRASMEFGSVRLNLAVAVPIPASNEEVADDADEAVDVCDDCDVVLARFMARLDCPEEEPFATILQAA